jgi:dTDP-4-dehydrorhamnose reductase
MSILITGCKGMLGGALIDSFQEKEEILCIDKEDLDLCDFKEVKKYIDKNRPEVIINAAAETRVDACEELEEHANMINGYAVGNLASICNELKICLVHISTDYVFDGKLGRPYKEEDKTNPLGVYGQSKLLGEKLLFENYSTALCIRTSWLFGPYGKNFVKTLTELHLGGKEEFSVVSDEIARPTYTRDLAFAVQEAVRENLDGIFHFANEGDVSWYDFASQIFHTLDKSPLIKKTTAKEYGLPAKRPENSAMDTSKYEQKTKNPVPHFQDSLRRYMIEEGWISR